MLGLKIAGSKWFCDQIKNKIERFENEGMFTYTNDSKEASIIISEEDACTNDPTSYVFIEIMKDVEGKMCALQYVLGEKVETFLIEDLPAVLQGTIMMVGISLEKQAKIVELEKKIVEIQEEANGVFDNMKNFQMVQENVFKEMEPLGKFETKLIANAKSGVSGDFLVTKEMPGKTFVFMGDVTGHGVYAGAYAATLVALAKNYFNTCSLMNSNLKDFEMYMANAAFYYHGNCQQSSAECIMCEIDHKRNVATFSTFSGGNISPIIIKKDGRVKVVFGEDDYDKIKPRLGDNFYDGNVEFETMPGFITERFAVGDTLLFYTDGFSEMFSKTEFGDKDQNLVYGVENMEKAVKDAVLLKGNDPEVVVKAVVSDISSYGVKGLYDSKNLEDLIYDDATMYCIKRKE